MLYVQTLVDTLRDSHGSPSELKERWTGVITSSPGPSRLFVPGEYPLHRKHDDAEVFAERFKYMVCSSGILQKKWMAGSIEGSDLREIGDVEDEQQQDGEHGVPPLEPENELDKTLRLWLWVKKARERWDVSVAGMILVIALEVIARRILFGGSAIVLGLLVVAAIPWMRGLNLVGH